MGYILERMNWSGNHSTLVIEGDKVKVVANYTFGSSIIEGAFKSGHRYSRGKNRNNYLEVARKILLQVANNHLREKGEGGQYIDSTIPDILVDSLMDWGILPHSY